ncbi:MAG: hypothetical protein IPJ41_06805 [Phycisphaerales bacterium]|nr:hypothetical protein [Phycisphaerales bacterium]
MTSGLFSNTMPRVATGCLPSLPGSAAGAVLEDWRAVSAVESNDPNFGRSTTTNDASGFGGQPVSFSFHVSRGGGRSDSLIAFDDKGVHSSRSHMLAQGHDDVVPGTDFILEFQVDQDSTYAIGGAYEAVGTPRRSGIADLWGRHTSQRPFRQQIDRLITRGRLPSWSWSHTLAGSTSGILEAGKKYRPRLDMFLRQRSGSAVSPVEGSCNLAIAPIPAPAAPAASGVGVPALPHQRR